MKLPHHQTAAASLLVLALVGCDAAVIEDDPVTLRATAAGAWLTAGLPPVPASKPLQLPFRHPEIVDAVNTGIEGHYQTIDLKPWQNRPCEDEF